MSDIVYPHPGLLAAVRAADPNDKLPRLVLADWLEENGDPDRAEFVRRQCGFFGRPTFGDTERQIELLRKYSNLWIPSQATVHSLTDYWSRLLEAFHLGFVETVTIGYPTAWVGEEVECLACEEAPVCYETNAVECSRCDGTGVDFVAGIGARMIRFHPIRQVSVRDVAPRRDEDGSYSWNRLPSAGEGWLDRSSLPSEVFERLPVLSEMRRFRRPMPLQIGYISESHANKELSDALILFAQENEP